MKNNASGKLYKIGIIILGLIIATYILFMILLEVGFVFDPTDPVYASIPLLKRIITSIGGFSVTGIPLIIPVSALFLVRKFPIVVGAIFLGIGGLLSSYWVLSVLIDGAGFTLLCPVSVLFLLDGILFLISGLIKRRYTLNNEPNYH